MLNLRKIRKSRGMTMKELGRAVGVSESAIGMYEKGSRSPNYEMLLRLSEVLKCTVDDLVSKKEKPAPDWDRLDAELVERLTALTPGERDKVDAFVQGLLASRED